MRRGGHPSSASNPEHAAVEAGENEPLVNRRPKATAKTKAKASPRGSSRVVRGRSEDARGRSKDKGFSPRGNLIGASLPPAPLLGDTEQPRQQSMPPVDRGEITFEQLLNQFRQAEDNTLKKKRAASSNRSGRSKPLTQDNLVTLEEMQRLVREMTKKHQELEKRAEASELEARRAEEQLAEEARSRRDAEQLRAQAAARVEQLEFAGLKFQAEREEWKQREAELQERGNSMWEEVQSRDQSAMQVRNERIEELEDLLKQAISRGARLGQANADIETSNAELTRKLSKIKTSAKTRMRRERRRLEAIIISMAQRAERAEDRLVEYLDASTLGADALTERHMRHLIEVCHELAEKVDEQADIIGALRTLLHDHKDFIRFQMPEVLYAPPPVVHGGGASHAQQTAPRTRQEPPALSALRECTTVNDEPEDMDSVDLSIVSAAPPKPRAFGMLPPAPPAQVVDDGAESSLDSFDEEIFGTEVTGAPAMQQVMPSDSMRRDSNTARARRKKKDDDDDEWPW